MRERAKIGLKKPGLGLPLDYMPEKGKHFPILVGYLDEGHNWHAATLLIREACMLKVMEDLTNKPEWWVKVYNEVIIAKWRTEALVMDWTAYIPHADFTPLMFDACIEELRKKATLYKDTSLIPVFDYSATAIKSDKILDEELRQELLAAVKSLEDVPEQAKDWHPGSDKQVLNLVHPSLWPLIYGKTRAFGDGERIGVADCLGSCGLGQVIAAPENVQHFDAVRGQRGLDISRNRFVTPYGRCLSSKFQWLPTDVAIDNGGHAKIESYINNLHPVENKGLYTVVERFIELALPAWDLIYRWPDTFDFQRLKADSVKPVCTTLGICQYVCDPGNRPTTDGDAPRSDADEDGDFPDRDALDDAWFVSTHPLRIPDAALDADGEPGCGERKHFSLAAEDVRLSDFFNRGPERGLYGPSRIQVIVKLANIHLTPEKPTYNGGSWHIEGQMNEHICATALYYYDNENITESRLMFRTTANREDLRNEIAYDDTHYFFLDRMFALRDGGGWMLDGASTTQDIGSVLTKQGRAVFFPNTYQHKVQPFSLADKSKPGHRKVLALFLVDPAIPIISTANVPPQQRHWWPGEKHLRSSGRVPPEVGDMILENADYVMGRREAEEMRRELMAERGMMQQDSIDWLQKGDFSFCEH